MATIKFVSISSEFGFISGSFSRSMSPLKMPTTAVTPTLCFDGNSPICPRTSIRFLSIPISSYVSRSAVSIIDLSPGSSEPPGKLTSPLCVGICWDRNYCGRSGNINYLVVLVIYYHVLLHGYELLVGGYDVVDNRWYPPYIANWN
mmetsp:Transcript_33490/g.56761  ORF Transcript_33490/g.56761 Transcript_33490/m.56761 type:complete len:146 (-) Transcript_33490:459-896(-)